MPEELGIEVCNFVQEVVSKTIPKKQKCNNAKWLSKKALYEMKIEEKQSAKEKRENIPIWMQNPKNSKDRYESLVKWAMQKTRGKQYNEGRLEMSSRKLEREREHFM